MGFFLSEPVFLPLKVAWKSWLPPTGALWVTSCAGPQGLSIRESAVPRPGAWNSPLGHGCQDAQMGMSTHFWGYWNWKLNSRLSHPNKSFFFLY